MNNNIVEENEKKSFKWWPIIIVVLLLIIGVIVYLITTGKFEKKLNPEKDNSKITDNTKETETSVKSGSLENNYRREIIANAQKFLFFCCISYYYIFFYHLYQQNFLVYAKDHSFCK